jgi:hypothetical protein
VSRVRRSAGRVLPLWRVFISAHRVGDWEIRAWMVCLPAVDASAACSRAVGLALGAAGVPSAMVGESLAFASAVRVDLERAVTETGDLDSGRCVA